MALGKRKHEEQLAWVATTDLPTSPGHPFYQKLNRLLGEAKFDEYVEDLCRPYYAANLGRPGIPPGVYFRMLFVGYFEGLDSQRGIAWRCHDSRSLQAFLDYSITDATPDHSSLTIIRQRLPLVIHEQVFAKVLQITQTKKLLKGKAVAVDWKSDLVLAAPVVHADEADPQTLPQTLTMTQANLMLAGSDVEIKDVPADKGYHNHEMLTGCQSFGIRTYIPERASRWGRRWTDKSQEEKSAVYKNRRRVRGQRGKPLGRLRSEYAERSFAHVCETDEARRSLLRSPIDVGKRFLMYVAARNLGMIMRALFNRGIPKSLQTDGGAIPCTVWGWLVIVPMRLRRSSRSSVPTPTYAINRSAFMRVHYAA